MMFSFHLKNRSINLKIFVFFCSNIGERGDGFLPDHCLSAFFSVSSVMLR